MAFTLEPERWYAWQMIPGYAGARCVPYCCPIWMTRVTPKKSGQGLLQLEFWNTGYAPGVQGFEIDLRMLHRGENYLIGSLIYDPATPPERCAVISHIEFGWIEHFCPRMWLHHPPHLYGSAEQASVSLYLDSVFKRAGPPNR